MRKIFVREEWCLGCHLCEYHCANANLGNGDMAKALKGRRINPRITVEDDGRICFAVSCRHCTEPDCKKSCISGAISVVDGVVQVDQDKCVGCYTCILACPYGTIQPNAEGHVVQKCELCLQNGCEPACVSHCPNRAIIYEQEGVSA
ncbi:MAG: 4Fe-4S binding protein [Oscillospiraceae bacterium]|jgi:carbon-monoxide dehydrogenase iron sulfur subunit|nr:4Fe-4S binding protein [Oscillospiraceae bacterium]